MNVEPMTHRAMMKKKVQKPWIHLEQQTLAGEEKKNQQLTEQRHYTFKRTTVASNIHSWQVCIDTEVLLS